MAGNQITSVVDSSKHVVGWDSVVHQTSDTSPKNIRFKVEKPIQTFTGREHFLKDLHRIVKESSIRITHIDHPSPHFTGRKELLQNIHHQLEICSKKTHWTDRVVVLCGEEGIEKSELARQYVKEYIDDPIIQNAVWINAETFTSLKESFAQLLILFGSNTPGHEAERNVKKVYKLFSDFVKVGLFVFDNAIQMRGQEMEILNFLPKQIMSSTPLILITSQFNEWQFPKERIIEIHQLMKHESSEFFIKQLNTKNSHSVRYLANYLQGSPLRIVLTASYVRHFGSSKCSLDSAELNYSPDLPHSFLFPSIEGYIPLDDILEAIFLKTALLQDGDKVLELLYFVAYLPPELITVSRLGKITPLVNSSALSHLDALSIITITKLPNFVNATGQATSRVQVHRLIQDHVRKLLDSRNENSYLDHICEFLASDDDLDYFENEAICIHRHLKTRSWPKDSLPYSVIFAAKLIIKMKVKSARESAWEIVMDINSYLNCNGSSSFKSEDQNVIAELLDLCLYYFSTHSKYFKNKMFTKMHLAKINLESVFERTLKLYFTKKQAYEKEKYQTVDVTSKKELMLILLHDVSRTLVRCTAAKHTKHIQDKIASLLLSGQARPSLTTVRQICRFYNLLWSYCKNDQYVDQMIKVCCETHRSVYRTLKKKDQVELQLYWETGGPFPHEEIVDNLLQNDDGMEQAHSWSSKFIGCESLRCLFFT